MAPEPGPNKIRVPNLETQNIMIIKKYSNRRLYDPSESRYVTLEEVAGKIQKGNNIQVIDAKSGKDLTQGTLAQIIMESRGAAKLLPVPLLVQLIRLEDDALTEFFSNYLSWALEVYVRSKQGLQTLASFNPFSKVSLPALPIPTLGNKKNPGETPKADSTEKETNTETPQTQQQVSQLRKELDELKTIITKLAKTKAQK